MNVSTAIAFTFKGCIAGLALEELFDKIFFFTFFYVKKY